MTKRKGDFRSKIDSILADDPGPTSDGASTNGRARRSGAAGNRRAASDTLARHVSPTTETKLDEIDLKKIKLRRGRRTDADRELNDSIGKSGILQPLLLRPVGTGFEVLDGGRRLAVARDLGLRTVPAVVRTIADAEARAMNAERKPATAAARPVRGARKAALAAASAAAPKAARGRPARAKAAAAEAAPVRAVRVKAAPVKAAATRGRRPKAAAALATAPVKAARVKAAPVKAAATRPRRPKAAAALAAAAIAAAPAAAPKAARGRPARARAVPMRAAPVKAAQVTAAPVSSADTRAPRPKAAAAVAAAAIAAVPAAAPKAARGRPARARAVAPAVAVSPGPTGGAAGEKPAGASTKAARKPTRAPRAATAATVAEVAAPVEATRKTRRSLASREQPAVAAAAPIAAAAAVPTASAAAAPAAPAPIETPESKFVFDKADETVELRRPSIAAAADTKTAEETVIWQRPADEDPEEAPKPEADQTLVVTRQAAPGPAAPVPAAPVPVSPSEEAARPVPAATARPAAPASVAADRPSAGRGILSTLFFLAALGAAAFAVTTLVAFGDVGLAVEAAVVGVIALVLFAALTLTGRRTGP